MELAAFKQQNNVSEISLYKSTLSTRHVGSLMLQGHKISVMTTKDFNKTSAIFVYGGEIDDTTEVVNADGSKTYTPTGSKKPCFIFSNNAGKPADMVL
jgi:hypothetical protein